MSHRAMVEGITVIYASTFCLVGKDISEVNKRKEVGGKKNGNLYLLMP